MINHYLQAVVLGAAQGITEFLPISSTAHLIILEKYFQLDQNTYGLSFDMFTNIGTTAALVIFFWKDLLSIFNKLRLPQKSNPFSGEEKLPWWILGSTVIVGIAGLLLEKRIEADFRSLPLIATSLVVVSGVMLAAEYYAKQASHSKPLHAFQLYSMGIAQILAFFPGVSRSGITISTGLFSGLNRSLAARYSFLLSAPITVAAIVKRLLTFTQDIQVNGITSEVFIFYCIGAVVAGLVGYFSIRFLISYLNRYSLAAFAYYRIALALLILVFLT